MRSPVVKTPLRLVWTALVSLCGLAACTSMETIDTSQLRSGSAVEPGDTVRVSTTDGEVLLITITAVSENALTGERPASRADEPDSGYETKRRYPDLRREVVIPMAAIRKLQLQVLDPEDPADTEALWDHGFGQGFYVGLAAAAVTVLFWAVR